MILSSQGQYQYRYCVDDDFEGTLKGMLIHRYDYSSRLLRQIKRDGEVTVNGKDRFLDTPVYPGDLVEIHFPVEKNDIIPVAGDLDIIYEDDEVLVVNKPPNCVTHPTKSHQEDTLANCVAAYWETQGVSAKIRFVNRLDRDTTGLVIIAKNKYVHHYIQSHMSTDSVKKTYIAFTNGHMPESSGCIREAIGRPTEDSLERVVMPAGKASITHYRVLASYKEATKLELVLETGRTHQIRVHLAHYGCSIIADTLYGDVKLPDYNMARQALHAAKLVLPLPKRGKIEVKAGLSPDLSKLESILRKELIEDNE